MGIGLARGTVNLVPYTKSWTFEFQRESKILAQILNIEPASIHHVGSTSIPNIMSKPIIDILVTFPELPELSYFDVLASQGYQYGSNGSTLTRIFFAKGVETMRTHYLHIVNERSPDERELLLFRDILRENEHLRKDYEDLKLDLSRKFKKNRDAYTKGKTKFIKSVLTDVT